MHDWVLANQRMAGVLADKGYQYQLVFRAQRRALRSQRETTDAAAGVGMAVEELFQHERERPLKCARGHRHGYSTKAALLRRQEREQRVGERRAEVQVVMQPGGLPVDDVVALGDQHIGSALRSSLSRTRCSSIACS